MLTERLGKGWIFKWVELARRGSDYQTLPVLRELPLIIFSSNGWGRGGAGSRSFYKILKIKYIFFIRIPNTNHLQNVLN